jgi:hypothetical protein
MADATADASASETSDHPACRQPSTAPGDGASISKTCCVKELVISQETSSATVPTGPDGGKLRVTATPAPDPILTDAGHPETGVRLGTLRAPPDPSAPPIFLLNASFLI